MAETVDIDRTCPRNLVSKKPYRGVSYFLLSATKYMSPYWLTMRRANQMGGHVRKGEESTIRMKKMRGRSGTIVPPL